MNDDDKLDKIAQILEEVRDNQKQQLGQQEELLAIQRAQFDAFMKREDRAAAFQDRAEALQDRSSQMINVTRKFLPLAIGIVLALILYVSWLLIRLDFF